VEAGTELAAFLGGLFAGGGTLGGKNQSAGGIRELIEPGLPRRRCPGSETRDRLGARTRTGKSSTAKRGSPSDGAGDLEVVFCLDVPRKLNDSSLEEEIVRRFVTDFRQRHWPWPQTPQLYFNRSSLATDFGSRASLHAKCIMRIDESSWSPPRILPKPRRRRILKWGF
jgi:hypothetical protein